MNTRVEFEQGSKGQFDILVDGRVVVTRKGGLLSLLLRKPWPTEEHVVTAVREAVDQAAG